MCRKLIFLTPLILLLVLVGAAGADTWHVVDSDIAVDGTVSGTYGATTHSNDVYESITEVSGSYSYLEHKWTMDVTGGTASIILYIEAHHTSNSEGDDFVFAYSTNDSTYTDLITVTKTSDNDTVQYAYLPESISGTIYIRVRDADRTNGNTELDTIYIDNIFVGCVGNTWWSCAESHLWDEPNNWWGGVPDGRFAFSNQTDYTNHILVDSTMTAICRNLSLAHEVYGTGDVYLVMTGGTFVSDSNLEMGCTTTFEFDGLRDSGVFQMIDGTATIAQDVYVGKDGDGAIDMHGGTVTINQGLYVPKNAGATGVVYLHDGSLNANSFSMTSAGMMNIEQGELVVNGNVQNTINGYVTNGYITAYDGDGTVNVDYGSTHSGKTTAQASIGKAWNPNPANGQTEVSKQAVLYWSKGDWDDTHQIYLGTSYSAVNSATTSSSEYKGSQNADSNSYNPGGLDLGRNYYWRIDEVNSGEGGSPWTGNVWNFTVTDYIAIEDFESYTDSNDLALTWIDGLDANNNTGSVIFLGTEFFERHGSNQSMVFDFDNSSSPYYSEVWRTFGTAQDLTESKARNLVLFFRGTEDCNVTEQLYLLLEDADSNSAMVTYDNYATDLVQQNGEYWHVWNIKLQDFNDAGVNEKAVNKIIVGFGNRTSPSQGNAGTVYFDDIRIHGHTCPAGGAEYLSDADFDTNDVVSARDFALFANAWMSSIDEPNFGDVYDMDVNDAVTTCDLGLFSDGWLWPNDQITITINAGSVEGTINPLINGLALAYCYSTDDIFADGSVADYYKEAGITALRYPGGGLSSYYHWEYPYMPEYQDPWSPWVDPNNYTSNTGNMDTDEFIALAQSIGAEPIITVNYQSGVNYKTVQDSVNDAVAWLTYCNITNDYNVIYWSLENEPYYANNGPAVDVITYADYVNQFATAMKAVDPNIKFIANWHNELNEPSYWAEWEYLIETSGDNFDYGDVHWYWNWTYGDWATWVDQNPMEVREWCADCSGWLNRYYGPSYIEDIQRFQSDVQDINGQSYDIDLLSLEWNVAPVPDREYSKFQQAMIQSEMLGQYIKGGLYMGILWPSDWGGDIDWNFRTVLDQVNQEPTPTFLVLKLYKELLGQQLVTCSSDVNDIFIVSALSQDGNDLWAYAVNKTADALTTQLEMSSFTTTSAEAIALLPDGNDIEADSAHLRQLSISYNPGTTKWQCVLPPFSLTRVTLHGGTPQLSKATNPSPANTATNVNRNSNLTWTASTGATSHNVFFGTSSASVTSATTSSSEFKGNQGTTTYDPGTLAYSTTYYWRIDELDASDTVTGDVWSFTTQSEGGGQTVWFNPSASTGRWDTAADWSPTEPNAADTANINKSGKTCIIDAITTAECAALWLPDWQDSASACVLDMNGGTLAVDGNALIGRYGGDGNDPYDIGILNLDSGAVTIGGNLTVGDKVAGRSTGGSGTINLTGGTIDVTGALTIAVSGATGTVDLAGGSLEAGSISMTSSGSLDIEAGILIIDGDVQSTINGYVTNGWITAYDGNGTVSVDYDMLAPGKTTATAAGYSSGQKIKVFADSIEGDISTRLLGGSLAYCYSTDSLYLDDSGDPNILRYLQDAGMKSVRYPGGGKSSYFHWEYPHMPVWTDAWDPGENPDDYLGNTHHMDVNEFAAVTEMLGATPAITVNFQSGTKYKTVQDSVNDAANWVQYMNVTNDYNVIYWSIENEPYYANNDSEVDVEQYASYVNQFSEAMKAVDSNIKIVANWHNELSDSNYWNDWDYFINTVDANIDAIDIHWYWCYSIGTWNQWINQNPMRVREWCPDCYEDYDTGSYRYEGPSYADEIKRFHREYPDLEFLVLEWNIGPVYYNEYSRCQHAMMHSEMIAQFIAGGLDTANIWPLEWGGDLGYDHRTILDQTNHEPTPTYLVFRHFKEALGQQLITSSTDNDHIYTVSALSQDGNTVLVYLVHKTSSTKFVKVDLSDFTASTADANAMVPDSSNIESESAHYESVTINYNSETGTWDCNLPAWSLTKITFEK